MLGAVGHASRRVWSFPPIGDLMDRGYSPGTRVSVGEGPAGEVLVAVTSPIDIRVDVWTSDGQPAFTLNTEGEGPGELLRPAGAVFLDGGLYVLDGRRLDIQVFRDSVFQDLIDVPFLAWGIETRTDRLVVNRIGGGDYTWMERSGEDWREISLPTEADDLAFLDVCNRVGFSGPVALVSSCYTDRVLVVLLDRPWTDFQVAHGIIAAIERDVGTGLEFMAIFEALQD